jgi:hypothetical protein
MYCYLRGISSVLLQFDAVHLVPSALSENKRAISLSRIAGSRPNRTEATFALETVRHSLNVAHPAWSGGSADGEGPRTWVMVADPLWAGRTSRKRRKWTFYGFGDREGGGPALLNAIKAEVPAGKMVHVNPRQLRRPEASQGPRLARQARALRLPLHANFMLLAQCCRRLRRQAVQAPLRRGVFRSVLDLQAAINRFLAETNANRSPSHGPQTPTKSSPPSDEGTKLDSIH